MIKQIGVDLITMAAFHENGAAKTGLSPTVDVFRNLTKIVTDGAGVEVEGGLYSYTLAAINNTAEGDYTARWKSNGTVDVDDLWHALVVGPIEQTWDVVLADHQTVGSTGEGLYNATQTGGGGQLTLLTADSTIINNGTQVGGTDANIDDDDGATWDIESAAGLINVEIVFDATNLFINEFTLLCSLTAHQNDYLIIEAWKEADTTSINTKSPVVTVTEPSRTPF